YRALHPFPTRRSSDLAILVSPRHGSDVFVFLGFISRVDNSGNAVCFPLFIIAGHGDVFAKAESTGVPLAFLHPIGGWYGGRFGIVERGIKADVSELSLE